MNKTFYKFEKFEESGGFFLFVFSFTKLHLEHCTPIACNGLQLPEGRDFYHQTSFGELNFRLPQMCLRSTKPRLLGRCCYRAFFFRQYTLMPYFKSFFGKWSSRFKMSLSSSSINFNSYFL